MKKKVFTRLSMVFSFICLIVVIRSSYGSAVNNQLPEQVKIFAGKYGTDVKIRYDNSGRPVRIGHIKTAASDAKPEDIALSFLSENKLFLDIDLDNLNFIGLKETKKFKHAIFRQVYKSVPVQGKDVRVLLTKKGEITFVKSNYYPHADLDVIPKITHEAAAQIVTKDLGIEKLVSVKTSFLEDGTVEKEVVPVIPELIIIPESEGRARLAWEFNFHLEDQGGNASWHYCIDALTGKLIRKCSLDQPYSISGNIDGDIFPTDGGTSATRTNLQLAMISAYWYDPTVPVWNLSNYGYTDPNGNYSLTYGALINTYYFFRTQTSGTKCQVSSPYYGIPVSDSSAYIYYDLPSTLNFYMHWADETYSKLDNNNVFYHVTNALDDYYYDKYNFNLGFNIVANVHALYGYPPTPDYAWYDPTYKTINFGIGGTILRNTARARDVILHELQHAITDKCYYPFPYGYATVFECAANEAYSDYFSSTITDDPDQGEWALRDSSEIRQLDSHVDEDNWISNPYDPNYNIYNNSLVISHILWSMRQDANIGQTEADNLIWGSLEDYSPDSWSDLYNACTDYCNPSDPNAVRAIFNSHVPNLL